jgi:hypothetical protein
MADARAKKLSELNQVNSISNAALMLVTDVAAGNTLASYAISVTELFGDLPVNIGLDSGNFLYGDVKANTIYTNNFVLGTLATPANSMINVAQGVIFYDTSYLYLAVANNQLMRVPLQAF